MSGFLPKSKPFRKPIADVDLLRLVDAIIFGEQRAKLTDHELAEARKTQPYQMMQRVGCAMYRAGEAGLRPKPRLMMVERAQPEAEAAPVDDEQPQPAARAPEVVGVDEGPTDEQRRQDHLSTQEA